MKTIFANLKKADTTTKVGLTILFGFILPCIVVLIAKGLKDLAYYL